MDHKVRINLISYPSISQVAPVSGFNFVFSVLLRIENTGMIVNTPATNENFVMAEMDTMRQIAGWCFEQFGPEYVPWYERDHRDGPWFQNGNTFEFKQADHATAFRLRWG